jgi:hypothetical protein
VCSVELDECLALNPVLVAHRSGWRMRTAVITIIRFLDAR